MKKLLALLLGGIMAVSMAACSSGQDPASSTGTDGSSQAENSPSQTADSSAIKVGVVLSTGGLGDKNFNDMTYNGLLKAQEDFGIEFDYVEPQSNSDFVPNHRMFAESEEYDLIIGLGSDQIEAIKEVGADFPDQKFSLVDGSLEQPNVSSVFTKWQEQTFLTGVIAGLSTTSDMGKANKENTVGVVLGMELPNLMEGVAGFTAGVRYVNPNCEVLTAVVGNFNDPSKGKEIALSMYNRGADFVQHIAGASGLGVFNAAKEANRYAFGVGGNQNANEPDYIVATAIRNVDEMVYNEVKALIEETWQEGIHVSGIKEGSVGYSLENSNVKLSQETLDAVEEIKAKIINGELAPCNSMDEMDAWVAENQYK